MRVFDHPNMLNFECPICKTNEDKPVVLIPITGTNKDDEYTYEAKQYHLKCIELMAYNYLDSDQHIIIQSVEGKLKQEM